MVDELNLEWARRAMPLGMGWQFSPSGHALALHSMFHENSVYHENFMACLGVYFDDDRSPLHYVHDDPGCLIHPLGWVSDDEVLLSVSGAPLGSDPVATIYAYSLPSGLSRHVTDSEDSLIGEGGLPGTLPAIFQAGRETHFVTIDGITGARRDHANFDAAIGGLDVYPLFGHAPSPDRNEIAVIGWPIGDYLPEGEPHTEINSQWSPILDEPSIQNMVSTMPDGSRVAQRELTREAKRKTPHRMFLLNRSGSQQEIPGSAKARRPLWSPDGTLLIFERYTPRDPTTSSGSISEVWAMRRDDLTLMCLGACSPIDSTVMHPSGILFCHLEDASIPTNEDHGRARARSSRWCTFKVSAGEIRPV